MTSFSSAPAWAAIPMVLAWSCASGCGGLEPATVAPADRPVDLGAGVIDTHPRTFDPGPLDIATALRLAWACNPRLAMLEHEVEAARGRERQAGLRPNPTLFAETSDGPLYRGPGDSKIVGGLSQAFPLGGRIAAAVTAAARAREAAEARLALAGLVLGSEVRVAFALVLAEEARLVLVDGLTEVARRSQEIAERRVRAGDAPQAEQLRAEVELQRWLLEREAVASERLGAGRRLAVLLGRPAAPLPALAGELPAAGEAFALDDLQQRVGENFPRLRALRLAFEAARGDLALARSEAVSDLSLSVGVGSSPQVRHQGESPLLEVGLSLPLPVFDRNQGRIAAARAEAGRATRELEAGRGELLLELQEGHRRYELARERLGRYQVEILPRAEQALEQARIGYEAGKFKFIDVLDAQRTLGEARAQRLEAQRDLAVARAGLAPFLGE